VVTPELVIGKEEKRPLMGQSNYMGNAGLYYDDKHLHVSLSYNSISNRMVVYEQDAINSQYERPMRSFDGQVAWRFLNQRAEVKLNISNLLNESMIVYRNGTKDPQEHEEAVKGNYSTKYLLYNKDTDALIQQLTPGRTYGLTISYLFK
jgi:outer membrane receptor protein involved in Fe transport